MFFAFLFFLIGLLSAIYSPFLLLIDVPLSFYLVFYKKKPRLLFFIFFSFLSFALIYFYPKEGKFSQDYALVIENRDTYVILLTIKGRYLYYPEYPLPLFSIIKLNGISESITSYHYQESFSFKDYLITKGVFSEFIGDKIDIFISPFKNDNLESYLFQYLDKPSIDIVSSLLFSSSLYGSDIYPYLNKLNLFSFFTIGGLHISFFFNLISKFIPRRKRKLFLICKIIFLIIFLFLSGFKYTLRRLFLKEVINLIDYDKKRINSLDKTSLTALILLFLEPYSLLSPYFYYPFPLVFFLSLFPKKRTRSEFVLLVSFFFLPLSLIDSYQYNLLTPLLQFFILPLTNILFLLSLLLFILPPIGILISQIIGVIIQGSDLLASNSPILISGLPSLFILLTFYVLFVLSFICSTYNLKREKNILLVSSILVISSSFLPDYLSHYEVTFIDVGQGDSTLIRYKRFNILIDTGGDLHNDLANECLIPYFHKRKIEKIDYCLITHLDYDHYGALNELKENFEVKNIYYPYDFDNLEDNTLDISGLKIKDLNNYNISNESNYQSNVFYFTIKETSFLITGDAPKEIEELIIQDNFLDIDILKVGHHGSKTSTSPLFLDAITPQEAVISVGENNIYSFPNNEVLNLLTERNIMIRRTDLEGSITFKL